MFFKPGFKSGNTSSLRSTGSKGSLTRNLKGSIHESNSSIESELTGGGAEGTKAGLPEEEKLTVDTGMNKGDGGVGKKGSMSNSEMKGGGALVSEEDQELAENKKQMLRLSMLVLFSFFALGVVVFTTHEKWTFVDSLYFVTVTLTTVGYGDQDSWSGDGIIWFMCFYALFGIMLIGSALGIITAEMVENADKAKEEARERLLDLQSLTPTSQAKRVGRLSSLSARLSSHVNSWASTKLPDVVVKLSPSILKMAFILVLGMLLIFFDHRNSPDNESPKFVHCLYFAIITGTTIGYGDYSPQTQWGRGVGVIYVFVAVIQLGNVLGDIAGHFVDAKRREALEKILKKKITVGDFEKFDVDGDGRIERTEFVLRKLMLMGILKTDDVDRVEQEFDIMDADGSGEITMDDLKGFIQEREERIVKEASMRTLKVGGDEDNRV
ncbi:hypothetical protein TrRE_jg3843 [Triparma retinervis]|uniref:EF-hand domain-containing protein n=1 Tax=Triparma retinervis TaxID=2557542 RepID=A0A9W7CGB9_9STRA|nr:hypothetical protein TrRE_jg3843 [Triparma retinervis]